MPRTDRACHDRGAARCQVRRAVPRDGHRTRASSRPTRRVRRPGRPSASSEVLLRGSRTAGLPCPRRAVIHRAGVDGQARVVSASGSISTVPSSTITAFASVGHHRARDVAPPRQSGIRTVRRDGAGAARGSRPTPNATTRTSTTSPTDSGRSANSQSTASTAMTVRTSTAGGRASAPKRAGVEPARGELTGGGGVQAADRRREALRPAADRPSPSPRTAIEARRGARARERSASSLPTSCS